MSWPLQTIEQTAETSIKVMTNGDIIFNVYGDIQIVSLVSECQSTGTAAASTVQYQSAPAIGVAAPFTGASASLITAVAGSALAVADGQTTAPSFVVSGANNQNTYPLGIWCPEGTINIIVAIGPTTSTWKHYIRYKQISASSYVTGI